MANRIINNGESGLVVRGKLNDNFTELNNSLVGVSVENYGAIGDGITDDTAAIQQCIDENISIIFDGSKNYKVFAPIVTAGAVRDFHFNGCTITAGTFMECVFHIKNKTSTHGYVYINGNSRATLGILLEAGGRSNLDNFKISKCRIWGVHISRKGNNNTYLFNQMRSNENGVMISAIANPDPTDPLYMILTEMDCKGWEASRYSTQLINNNYNQFEFIVDDSGYNKDGNNNTIYTRRVFMTDYINFEGDQPVVQDPLDERKARVRLRGSGFNKVNSDYINKPVKILCGGGMCAFKRAEGSVTINQLDCASEPIALSLGTMYGGFIGTFTNQFVDMVIGTDYLLGASIGHLYLEGLGQDFEYEKWKKGIVLCTFYERTRIASLSSVGNIKEENVVVVASRPVSYNGIVILQKITGLFFGENIVAPSSTFRKEYDNYSNRQVTQKRAFHSTVDALILRLTDINDMAYNGFSPMTFYFQKTSDAGNLNISLASDTKSAGYSIRGATASGQWKFPVTSLPTEFKVTIILFDKEFVVTIEKLHINQIVSSVMPLGLTLSNTSIVENNLVNEIVGTFAMDNPEVTNTFTYSLVTGEGDTDNLSFAIDGTYLRALEVFDFETKPAYSIRVRSTRNDNLEIEKVFTISVEYAWTMITDFTLSNSSILENAVVDEFNEAVVGTIEEVGGEPTNIYNYQFVQGEGDDDNSSFKIENKQLIIISMMDYDVKPSYSIRIRCTDLGGSTLEKVFTIQVLEVI